MEGGSLSELYGYLFFILVDVGGGESTKHRKKSGLLDNKSLIDILMYRITVYIVLVICVLTRPTVFFLVGTVLTVLDLVSV